nr:putative ribonuclease H-like domain-containing protein [Tanacetum cinerariifolium]
MGHFARECRAPRNQERGRKDTNRQESKAEEQTPKALMAIDEVGWDWSYMANDEEDHALHNMYSIDLNNIVPHRDLTCLVAKASADECNLWHRRLGTKVDASKDVKKDVSSLRYIVLPNWGHEEHLESTSSQPQCTRNTDVPESSGNSNPTATSTILSVDQLGTLTVETPIPTVSSPVPTACFSDSQEPSSATRLISKRVTNQEDIPSLDNILTLTNQFEDILGDTSNSVESNGMEADSFIATIHQKTDPALLQFCLFSCFLSQVEPKKISDALQDPSWVEAMQEELLQFKIQKVWSLVDCPKGVRPIGTKWVLKNKKDERGIVVRNKARLVA